MRFTIDELIAVTGAEVVARGTTEVMEGLSIDSRAWQSPEWFAAIKGPHFDAHDFIPDVLKRGCPGIIVSSAPCDSWTHRLMDSRTWVLRVADTVTALGSIAAHWRQAMTEAKVIGITGSNGKSTTKEMITAIAAARGPVLKTEGNYNNLIGLPLTIFRWQPTDRTAVVEMGMSAAGEIAVLTRTLQPDIGLITNVTAAHLEQLATVENVAQAKGELFATMPADGTIIVNQEDPWVTQLAETYGGERITFGMRNGCDVQFGRMTSRGLGPTALTLYVRGVEYRTEIPVPGTHNVMNALAATATGLALAIPVEAMMERLPHFQPMRMRMERVQLENGIQVVNDSYNANPESVRMALRTVAAAKRAGRLIVVLGDMLELGPEAATQHRAIGQAVADAGAARFFACGAHAEDLVSGARAGGLNGGSVISAPALAALQEPLATYVGCGDVILVKGSRGMHMERLVEFLKTRFGVC